ncbi:unnamed protein product [Lactuca virosa]|uniref:Uncharacterized protein n=1 Tax=Lactuca virosa TaxID=75947 RepID=A0AAU9NAS8_9ASTR|nr:unnamed protein product [Lactuca virosa]
MLPINMTTNALLQDKEGVYIMPYSLHQDQSDSISISLFYSQGFDNLTPDWYISPVNLGEGIRHGDVTRVNFTKPDSIHVLGNQTTSRDSMKNSLGEDINRGLRKKHLHVAKTLHERTRV